MGEWYMIMLHSKILYMYLQIGFTFAFSDCDPAEEGKQYQISVQWTTRASNTTLTVRRNDHMIGGCDTSHCSSYYSRFNIWRDEVTDQQFVIHVTIKNVIREDAINWTISHIGNFDVKSSLLFSCFLVTIVRPDNVTCHSADDMNGHKVSCTTNVIFPAAKCLFLVYINGKKISATNNIVYENMPMKSTELPIGHYFKSSCTYTISKSLMEPGDYLINVTIAPEIIKPGDEEKYGLTTTIRFHIESSKVKLENCPRMVEVNTTITCTCVIIGKRKTSNVIRWYSQDDRLLHNGSSITLTGSRSLTEYKCEGDIYRKSKNPSVVYSPVVLDTKKNINCSIEETNENIQVICSTHEICSRVSCIFNVTYSRTDTGFENSRYVMSTLEEHSNCSTCTLYLKRSHFDSAGVYNIKITFSLDTSDISQHIVYEANSFLQFLKVDDSHRRDKTSARFFQIVSISSVAAVLFLMMSSALIYIAVLQKRKKQRKIESRKSVKNVKTYENRLSIQSAHNYECIQPEDHYDRCVDLVRDDEDRQQDQPMQDIVDTEYITPIEIEHIHTPT
uniref:Ig-like domain-containing protein n=1 Tax=Biomphalaria glabrata TaxID=6526 RepID=A0A2C9LZN1_BIOGL